MFKYEHEKIDFKIFKEMSIIFFLYVYIYLYMERKKKCWGSAFSASLLMQSVCVFVFSLSFLAGL